MKRSSFITWEQLKVGALVLVALAVLSISIYKLGQAANLFSRRYDLFAFLAEANGLRVGGTVFVAGQFAGTIRSIEFLPVDNDTTRNLKVRMAVDEGLREQIRADSAALLDYRPRYRELSSVQTPVLLLGGDRSASYFRATLLALVEALPKARLEVVPGAGHMLHAEASRRFAQLLMGFAEDVGIR